VGTTKEPPTTGKGAPPTTGKGAPPTTTTEEDDDDDEEIAEGVPPVDASTVANAEKVGASGADQSRVVVTGGEPWVGGGGQGGGKQAPTCNTGRVAALALCLGAGPRALLAIIKPESKSMCL
jgi:hypothetical protein